MRTTGLGSMPGRDFRAATRVVAEVFEAVLAMPEVPLRDASSAIIGRTLGLLAQPCELDATGWR
ncbi:MAG: methionine synthase, partial [Brooklawnia sp.]